MKNKGLLISLSAIAGLFLITGICFDAITPKYQTSIDNYFSKSTLDKEGLNNVQKNGYKLNEKLLEEGSVLLKNKNNILPLEKNSKVNLFGIRSAHLVLNGSGSAAGTNSSNASLKDGLENVGFEINKPLYSLLENTKCKDRVSVDEGGKSVPVNEIALDKYVGEASFENAKAFSNTAIVTFSRIGGEGGDASRDGLGKDKKESYLELCENEIKLLKELKSKGFNVVVLLNTSYPMEAGFVDELDIDACLWIGGPGCKGAYGIGKILSGEVTPSGHLVDTWAYDHETSSTFITTKEYKIVDDTNKRLSGLTDFNEGIYVGYRWYETAYAEGFFDSMYSYFKFGKIGYENYVQYPFGYGLSYTDFDRKIESVSKIDNELIFNVSSKNIGSTYSGKDVLQLYVEKPYIEGGIEKAKVELVGFEKTSVMSPNGTDSLKIKVNIDDLASYDSLCNDGRGGYSLDEGTYKFYLASDSHGYVDIPSDCYYEYSINETKVYNDLNKRSSDKVAAKNELSDANKHSGEPIKVLSRKNGFANASETIFAEHKDLVKQSSDPVCKNFLENAAVQNKAYQGEILSNLDLNKKSSIKLDDLVDENSNVDFDDSRWDELLASLSFEELNELVGNCGWSTPKIDKINKLRTLDIDGPFGLSDDLIKGDGNDSIEFITYCSEPVMAATFNKELLHEYGLAIGDEANYTNVAGWYAPGANLHRSQYGGRNPEYYSEDPYLSGVMASYAISGASSKGLYTYMKHFAFNDIEANRTSKQVCTFDEQTARELYLKPFEIAIKANGIDEHNIKLIGAPGLMVSYMWIGETSWGGANYNLMTNIVRNEWGFKGVAITDNAGIGTLHTWMGVDVALKAGVTMMLVYNKQDIDSSWANTKESISALKIAAKYNLYNYISHNARRENKLIEASNSWNVIYPLVNALTFGIGGLAFASVILVIFLPKKKEN